MAYYAAGYYKAWYYQADYYTVAAAGVTLDGITSGDGGLGLSCATGVMHQRASPASTAGIKRIDYAVP